MKASIRKKQYWCMLVVLAALAGTAPSAAEPVDVLRATQNDTLAGTETPVRNDHDGIAPAPEDMPDSSFTAPADPPPEPPEDPCLPSLYRNWHEPGLYDQEQRTRRFNAVRLLIDRSQFMLTVEGILPDGSTEDLYFTHIGLGDTDSPTPAGLFFINHIYCYPDVVYFDPDLGPIPHLYDGFLAPLLVCDKTGKCTRFRELGLHGFDASVFPDSYQMVDQRYGPVSGGCIRVPDPCKLKALLVGLVGVGPLKRNDRGCYHWLKQPVEVVISGEYPYLDEGADVSSWFGSGLRQVRRGLQGFFGMFRP